MKRLIRKAEPITIYHGTNILSLDDILRTGIAAGMIENSPWSTTTTTQTFYATTLWVAQSYGIEKYIENGSLNKDGVVVLEIEFDTDYLQPDQDDSPESNTWEESDKKNNQVATNGSVRANQITHLNFFNNKREFVIDCTKEEYLSNSEKIKSKIFKTNTKDRYDKLSGDDIQIQEIVNILKKIAMQIYACRSIVGSHSDMDMYSTDIVQLKLDMRYEKINSLVDEGNIAINEYNQNGKNLPTINIVTSEIIPLEYRDDKLKTLTINAFNVTINILTEEEWDLDNERVVNELVFGFYEYLRRQKTDKTANVSNLKYGGGLRMKRLIKRKSNLYEQKGFKNRKEYLKDLSKTYHVSYNDVKSIARDLGKEEDFEELVSRIKELENSEYNEGELFTENQDDEFLFEQEEVEEENNNSNVDNIVDKLMTNEDLSDYQKISDQMGSNDGGLYEDDNGNQIYVKNPISELHAQNEVLASALYRAVGVNMCEVNFGEGLGSKNTIYTPIVASQDVDLYSQKNNEQFVNKLREDFVVDAWLCNWDVIGMGYENVIVDENGDPFRIDPGGSLMFRAQGQPKSALGAFTEDVPELETLRDPRVNRQSSSFFGGIEDEQLINGAQKLLNITESQIDTLVDTIITDENAANEIKSKLKARRNYILEKFNLI